MNFDVNVETTERTYKYCIIVGSLVENLPISDLVQWSPAHAFGAIRDPQVHGSALAASLDA